MKKGTVVISGLLALALAGAGVAGIAEARPVDGPWQGHHAHKGYGMPYERQGMIPHRLMERLGLSDEQRDAIREVRKARTPEAHDKFRALREVERELRGYAMREDFDVHRARELAATRAELQAELTVLRLSGFHEAYQVLTEEQKAQLAEWRDRQHRHGKKPNRSHRQHRDGHPSHG